MTNHAEKTSWIPALAAYVEAFQFTLGVLIVMVLLAMLIAAFIPKIDSTQINVKTAFERSIKMKMRTANLKNERQIQKHHSQNLSAGLFNAAICLISCAVFFAGSIQVNADVKRGAATGAAVGGLIGLVFGGDLGDVAAGAAVGAGVGAAGGAVSGSMKKKEAEKKAQQQQAAKAQQAAKDQERQEQALIHAIGEDNYRGLVALVDCDHKRAEGLAEAGAASNDPNHRLASLWLKALIANDLKQTERTAELYQQLISADPDIDTLQQASIESDKVLMDVREERRASGITCQP